MNTCKAASVEVTTDALLSRRLADGISVALASSVRDKFYDLIPSNRQAGHFERNAVIYEVGDITRTLFFIRRGFAKVGTVTTDGHEIIYDIRKSGDVIGELCLCERSRSDRAIALEETEVIAVPFQETVKILQGRPDLLALLLEAFGRALIGAYEQINTLAIDDTPSRLVKALMGLAETLGRPVNGSIELPIYLTQEEISQMVAARRERISTVLNSLRRRGAIKYSSPGRLLLNMEILRASLDQA